MFRFKKAASADIGLLSLEDSPLLKTETIDSPELPLIAVGGAGIAVARIIKMRMKDYGLDYPLAAIDLDHKNLTDDAFHSVLKLGESKIGTACQYRKAVTVAEIEHNRLQQFITDYLAAFGQHAQHEIVFLLLGAGGTGVGVSLELIKTLKQMKMRPVPILILPFNHEMSRTQFTAAVALYLFTAAPGNRSEKLTTLAISNQLFVNKKTDKMPETDLIGLINGKIAAAITDLFVSTVIPENGYSTDLNEFLEVFRSVRGFGTLLSLDARTDTDLSELITNNTASATGLNVAPTKSIRSYSFIQGKSSSLTAENYRNFFSLFENSDIFHRLAQVDEGTLSLRGVYVGYHSSPEVNRCIQIGEDVRVVVLNREKNKSGDINSKIDHRSGDEELDTKMPDEIRDELAKESAALRRGEHSE